MVNHPDFCLKSTTIYRLDSVSVFRWKLLWCAQTTVLLLSGDIEKLFLFCPSEEVPLEDGTQNAVSECPKL
jgi:hypothetical protein